MIGLIVKSSQVVVGCAVGALAILRGSVRKQKQRPEPVGRVESFDEVDGGYLLRVQFDDSEFFRKLTSGAKA